MTIRDTSLNAYHSLDLTESEAKVMRWFHAQKPGASFNRRQISELSRIPINCIAGRVFDLIEKGYLEELPESVTDPVTGKKAYPVRIKARQAELFAA